MLYVSTMYNMQLIIIMWLRMCCHSFSHTNSIENNIIFTCFKPHVFVCSLWNIIRQNLVVYECPPSIVAKFINYQIREIQGQLQGALDWVWNNIHTVLFFFIIKEEQWSVVIILKLNIFHKGIMIEAQQTNVCSW